MNLTKLREIQEELSRKVKIRPFRGQVKRVAGCDVSYTRDRKRMAAVFVVFSYPELELKEVAREIREVEFPYIPTFLSFREMPALVAAYRKLTELPDLVLVDGQGLAHPRKLGLASHLGVELGIATIGVAKSHLYGEYMEPGPNRGDYSILRDKAGRPIGAVLRTRDGVKPLFISPGNEIDIGDSIRFVLELTRGYRLPEPIRFADRLSRELLKKEV